MSGQRFTCYSVVTTSSAIRTPSRKPRAKSENKIDLTKPVTPDKIDEAVKSAKEGDTVKVDMTKTTTLPDDALKAIKGKNVTVELDMGNGVKWTINGKDVTDASKRIDMSVTVGTADIPIDVINNVSGERYNIVISLAHNGDFGFKVTLTIEMRKQDVGLCANLYYYNPKSDALEYISCGQIKEDGTVDLDFSHASDYTIIVDDHPLGNEIKADSYKITVKMCYKPVLKATAGDGKITLKWSAVNNAEKYAVYKYVNGAWTFVKETKKQSLGISGVRSGKTYKYAVCAYVNNDWTKIGTASTATVKVK